MTNHPNRKKIGAPDGAPAVGSFVSVPFGSRATQIAQVCGYGHSKHGGPQIKVRAWNGTQKHWMPNARPVTYNPEWIKPASASHLPPPPAA